MDVLSDILRRIQLRGSTYFCSDFHGAWGMEEGASNRGMFHILMRGHAWMKVAGQEPVSLAPGDIVVLPHGDAHWLADHQQTERRLGAEVIVSVQQGDNPFTEGSLGATLLCGYFDYDVVTPHPFIKQLPSLVLLKTEGVDDNGWLLSAVRALSAESRSPEPGREVLTDRLTEVVLIEVFRRWMHLNAEDFGMLEALSDSRLAKAFSAIHGQPGERWTVELLAKEAGMSRTAFAQSFHQKTGLSPLIYLTNWRMALARERFMRGDSVLDVALSLGYGSEAAFSKAFKKVLGVTPGHARRDSTQ